MAPSERIKVLNNIHESLEKMMVEMMSCSEKSDDFFSDCSNVGIGIGMAVLTKTLTKLHESVSAKLDDESDILMGNEYD